MDCGKCRDKPHAEAEYIPRLLSALRGHAVSCVLQLCYLPYSGNFLGGTPSRGPDAYADWQGLALESEFLPDSPNHPEWPQPDCFLRPGEEYASVTEYRFIPA